MGRSLILLGEGAADFPEFFHEIVSSVDAASGVADEELCLLGDGLLVGMEADRGGICVRISGDHGQIQACAPSLKLLDGGSAEGVRSGEEDGVISSGEPQAELGGGGSFPGAVHADDEDDEGLPIRPWGRREEIIRQALGEVAAGDFDDVVPGNFPTETAEFAEDCGGETDAEVRADQVGFEVVPLDFGAVGDLVE